MFHLNMFSMFTTHSRDESRSRHWRETNVTMTSLKQKLKGKIKK